ncbi:MAG TPA: TonB-dependent receptor, partial [Opitutaceae bacterium]
TASVNILSWKDDLTHLYTGASQGYDDTKSKSFVWQGKLLNDAIVPLFGWRSDHYTRWDKPSSLIRDVHNTPDPFSPRWNYDTTVPLDAKEERRSWGLVVHTSQILDLFDLRLPKGVEVSLTYNDSNSFRPSEVGRDIYGNQLASPSGETKDYGVIVSALDNKVSVRMNWFETAQKNTTLPNGPSFYWAKAGIARTMNTLAQETWGSWSEDGSQTAPEALVNRWFFGNSYDTATAAQPLPANWRDVLSTLVNEPLRIRSAAVPGSSNYVAQGDINQDTGVAYLAPPLTADEVAYREAWFAARTDAEWFRPLEGNWVAAEQFEKISGDDYRIWGESPPAGQKLTNDLVSKGFELELTANPLPNWRLTLNAARIDAQRNNILPDWEAFVAANRELWFDGYNNNPGGPSQLNYWTIDGFADLRHWGGTTSYSSEADTFGGRMMQDVYGPYLNAIAGEGVSVSELRKWRVNFVTNYTFRTGLFKNVNVGGAVRWQDKTAIGYLPQYNEEANLWVTNVSKPFYGPTETSYDMWIGYARKLGKRITWEVQLNVRDLFADDELIPIQANPDGTYAQVRIPAETTWSITNTFKF